MTQGLKKTTSITISSQNSVKCDIRIFTLELREKWVSYYDVN